MFLPSCEHTIILTSIMNIPVTVFMCICWSMFPLFWKIYSLKGSRLAPVSNLSGDIWTHACVDKIPQPDSAHQSKHIRWRLQKKKRCVLHWRWAHMASTILMRTTAARTHPGAVLGMKLPCFHSSFLPQTKNPYEVNVQWAANLSGLYPRDPGDPAMIGLRGWKQSCFSPY